MYTGNTQDLPDYPVWPHGLSLCIQGTLKITSQTGEQLRFIPVYTENTEKNNEISITAAGLSLCIQGTLYAIVYAFLMLRFIPVYTGNTIILVDLTGNGPVYPCVYREHSHRHILMTVVCGLSLCIQGTQQSYNYELTHLRFIPVYTGNTLTGKLRQLSAAVYPCVYREHTLRTLTLIRDTGLSLCIQGTL